VGISVTRTDWAMAQQIRVQGSVSVGSGSHTVTVVVSGGPRSTTWTTTLSGPADQAVDVEHFAIRSSTAIAANVAVVVDGTTAVYAQAGTVAARPAYGTALRGTHMSPHVYDNPTTMALLPSQGVVSLGVAWSTFQPVDAAHYDATQLALYDATFADLATRGCKAIVTFGTTPAWARSGGTTLTAATNPADHAAFIAFCAARWSSVISWVNPWNEVNLPSFWPSPNTTTQYVQLLAATKTAVAAAAPSCKVCLGPFSLGDYTFVDGLFSVGLTGAMFDAVDMHPYPWSDKITASGEWYHPSAMPPAAALNGSVVGGIHKIESVLASHGVTGKPLVCSEFGAATNPVDTTTPQLRLADSDAAAWVAIIWDQLRRMPQMEAICLHEAKDTNSLGGWANSFGVLDAGNNRRASYATL
jgi:hypothetical protein